MKTKYFIILSIILGLAGLMWQCDDPFFGPLEDLPRTPVVVLDDPVVNLDSVKLSARVLVENDVKLSDFEIINQGFRLIASDINVDITFDRNDTANPVELIPNLNAARFEKEVSMLKLGTSFKLFAFIELREGSIRSDTITIPTGNLTVNTLRDKDGQVVVFDSRIKGLRAGSLPRQYGLCYLTSETELNTIPDAATIRTMGNCTVQMDNLVEDRFVDSLIFEFGDYVYYTSYVDYQDCIVYGDPEVIFIGDFWSALTTPVTTNTTKTIRLADAVSFTIGEKAYIGTGRFQLNDDEFTNNFFEFNPSTNEWLEVDSFPGLPRDNAVAFTLNGKAYVGSGRNQRQTFQDFYEFDPSKEENQQWVPIPSAPVAFSRGIAFSLSNKGYIGTGCLDEPFFNQGELKDCIGFINPCTFNQEFWSYDPLAKNWDTLNQFPFSLTESVAFSQNNIGYVATGTGFDTAEVFLFKYEVNNDSWEKTIDFPGFPRDKATGYSSGGNLYLGFGQNCLNEATFNDFYRFDPTTSTWTQIASLPSFLRYSASGFVLDRKLYLLSGIISNNTNAPNNEFWVYTPD